MPERGHHSIGEVLSLLKDDFPDITISKIRFLESQGLIEPERTPSGYRKFYGPDVDRLRWILTQQRDNFLPLKVMKHRLAEAGFQPVTDRDEAPAPAPEPTLFRARREADTGPAGESGPADAIEPDPSDEPAASATVDTGTSPDGPVPRPEPRTAPGPAPRSAPLAAPEGSVSLTAPELAAAAGVDVDVVDELARMGLVAGTEIDGEMVFDDEALLVARAAASFARRGLEPRHLRMFKIAADREVGVLEQVIQPLVKRSDGSAVSELNELIELGETIHRSVLRRLLGPQIR